MTRRSTINKTGSAGRVLYDVLALYIVVAASYQVVGSVSAVIGYSISGIR